MAITSTCTDIALLRTTADALDAALAYCVISDSQAILDAPSIQILSMAREDLVDCGNALLERWGPQAEWHECLYMMHEIDIRLPDRD